ncbi:anti-sigma factor [Methylobacterium sp. NEAU 140]|uniref:anti-sigma factor n=1 Tax=Methylobacterium sp. NEAU 140 TaxID=3064945 RepID=UPI00273359CB|nr:anti-sigma factor [Methylobacterium sp. NEAU 140]MDP4026763.1 anti-sigma factor [Methylobacterium sp. NEAU 140]
MSADIGWSEADLRAAEYVLGTLDAEERAAVVREVAADPMALARLRDWERRFAPLMDAVPVVPPPPGLRDAILRAVRVDPLRAQGEIAALRIRLRRWQRVASGAGLLAAGLALFVTVGPLWRAREGGARYLAVVQGGGAVPALIVQVDLAAGTAQVRPISAEAPAGRSLEMWYVGAAGPKPLGLVGAVPSRISLPPDTRSDGTIAVSVEPPGGSPSGQPTGPVIYTGKLIAE